MITLEGMVRVLTVIDNQLDLEDESSSDTSSDSVKNLLDTIAILLVDDSIKENAGVFQEARGFQMMLRMIVEKPELRKDALKVISFGLTKCKPEQAIKFVDSHKSLAILFGLWMKQPDYTIGVQISKEHA